MTQRASSPWIVSPWFDSVFFIGTPILCLLAFLPIQGHFSSQAIFLAVMAFSSFGHHLPGFLRAYGDAELFSRFRWRFLLAPPLIFGVCLFFGFQNLHGMLLVLMGWSIWHVMMQHYGFMRIYDSKVGATDPGSARFDFWISLLWFVSIVLASPQYTHNLIDRFYESSHILIPQGLFAGLRNGIFAVTAAATLVYLGRVIRRLRNREPLSVIKLVLMVLTLGFLYVVWVQYQDIYLGLAIWEVFHDIQYFAITFLYNKRLVQKGMGNTRLMTFLFRQRLPLIGLYVIAIFAYGGINYWIVTEAQATAQTILMAFVFTSTLLHYYYDGFIWKVRQPRTREGLDLVMDESLKGDEKTIEAGGLSSLGLMGFRESRLWRGLAHILLFAVPFGALAAMELSRDRLEELPYREAMVALVPEAPESKLNLAIALDQAGRGQEALAMFEGVITRVSSADAFNAYGVSLLENDGDRFKDAVAQFERAIELEPTRADLMLNLAVAWMEQGRLSEAVSWYRRAVDSGKPIPAHADSHTLAGWAGLEGGDFRFAKGQFEEALKQRPFHLEAKEGLFLIAEREEPLVAIGLVDELIEQTQGRQDLVTRRIYLLLATENMKEALPALNQGIEAYPEDLDLRLCLAEILATNPSSAVRDGRRAVALSLEIVEKTQSANVGAMDILGAAYAESGDFESAQIWAARALNLARGQDLDAQATLIQNRLEGYRAGRPYHMKQKSDNGR